ncbi:MAG TPA: endonuclease/exonuclease/phosphatase family protein [Opitutaceae bacterium]|jgi:endonuclease/exonuclease/phosphatase (EEP) superfamily protein YafD|nr:endonuclease/exonuclease/phosphatase family protein [Opitutaceae bacterium]
MSTFRVLQFNMQFGQAWDDTNPDSAPIDVEATLAEIRRHEADVVFLQEVEQARPGGVQPAPPPNFTRLRAALAGYDSFFSYPRPDPRELPFGIGLAIFSKTPLRDTFRRDLPSPPIEFDFNGRKTTPTDRLLIGAKTALAGRELQLLNTHLLAFFMLGSTSEKNNEQRRLVADHLRAAAGPALLAGDFNVRLTTSLIAQFAKCGFTSVQQAEPTWRRHPYVLDHIFHNAPLRPVRHAVQPTRASDHHVLVVDFEFAG